MAVLNELPEELHLYIVSFLDIYPPSSTKFTHEPSFELTNSKIHPLKSLSCTCRMWRRILVPILFQHARINLSYEPRYVAESRGLLDHLQSNFEVLNHRERCIFLRLKQEADGGIFNEFEAFSSDHINLGSTRDGDSTNKMYLAVYEADSVLKEAPMLVWCHRLPKDVRCLFDLLRQRDMQDLRSLVILTVHTTHAQVRRMLDTFFNREARAIWSEIFSNLNPQRLLIVASPETLALLASLPEDNGDIWAFEMQVHYLELRQSPNDDIFHRSSCARKDGAYRTSVIHDRAWTHIGYNEGSSVPAYSTYEYSWKQSPKILAQVMQDLAFKTANCCGVRSFCYVAVFPLASNHRHVVGIIRTLNTLQYVHYQLTPGSENDVLDNKKKLRRAQHSDLWMECDRCYHDIILLGNLSEHCTFSTADHSVRDNLSEKFAAAAVGPHSETWREVGPYRWQKV